MKPSKWVITAIGIFLMFFNSVLPPIMGLGELGMSIFSIFLGTLLMLIFVDVRWPGILCILAYATNGVYPLNTAIQMSLGHNIFWLIALAGIILGELVEAGLIRRIAVLIITRPIAKKSPWIFVSLLFIACVVIGSFMEATITIILMIALGNEILNALSIKRGSRTGELIMMGVMIWCGTSYGTSPFGHPVPLTMMARFSEAGLGDANMLQYTAVGVVATAVFFVFGMLIYKYMYKMDVSVLSDYDPETLLKELKPMSKREKLDGIVYICVIIWWLIPPIIQNILPGLHDFMTGLGNNAPLIVAITVMSLLQVEGKPLLDLGKQLKDGVPWVASFIVGVNMLLGASLQHPDAGISQAISETFRPMLASVSPFIFVLIINLIITLMTNFCSNMLTSTLFASVAITLMNGGAIVGVNGAALGITIGLTSTLAFAAPSAATWAALTAGDGWVRPNRQLIEGLAISIVGWLVFVFVGYNLACMIL